MWMATKCNNSPRVRSKMVVRPSAAEADPGATWVASAVDAVVADSGVAGAAEVDVDATGTSRVASRMAVTRRHLLRAAMLPPTPPTSKLGMAQRAPHPSQQSTQGKTI